LAFFHFRQWGAFNSGWFLILLAIALAIIRSVLDKLPLSR
jgi:hypothetical protein